MLGGSGDSCMRKRFFILTICITGFGFISGSSRKLGPIVWFTDFN